MGYSAKQWEQVVEKFYIKYDGIKLWHDKVLKEATTTGQLNIPTGRTWKYEMRRNKRGELEWPITTMKNYPVQGLEADMMVIVRVSLAKRLRQLGNPDIFMVNSVHDSVLVDAPSSMVDKVVSIIADVFRTVPTNFHRLFGVEFNLPFRCEIMVGDDWLNMKAVYEG